MAILLALQWVKEVKPDRVVICSDSCAVLMSLQSFTVPHIADKTCFMMYYTPMTGLNRWVYRLDLLQSNYNPYNPAKKGGYL